MSSEGLCLALSSSPSHDVGVRVVLVVDVGWKWSTKVEAFVPRNILQEDD